MFNRIRTVRTIVVSLIIITISAVTFASPWTDALNFFGLTANEPFSTSAENATSAVPMFATTVTTNGGSGLAFSYGDLATAITALNAATITSPVVITVSGTETAPAGGYSITATGTAANTITIDGNSGGTAITANGALTSGALNDSIFKIIGGDYITIQGFVMQENPANTTKAALTDNMTEWGVALLYASTTNGSQNCTIQNNTISLNRTYQNTFGIYSNSSHSATAVTASATATTAAGGNENLKVYGNIISNVNMGIVHIGPTAAADQNISADIGGATAPTGNSITDFGTTTTGLSGYANLSGTINGILVRNTKNFNISRNTIASSNGGITAGTVNGIQIPASSFTPTGTLTQTINNNNISLRPGANLLINGINMPSGSVNATTTCSINNNDFNTLGHTVAATSAITFIIQGGNPLNQTFDSNTFTNISVNTTGTITFFSFAPSLISTATMTMNNNSSVTGFTRTGVGTTTIWSSNASSAAGSTQSISNNNFSNFTLTGASAFNGIVDTDSGTPTKTINGNTISNITTEAGTVIPISVNYSAAGSTVNNNIITGITTGNSITALLLGSSNGATLIASGNTIGGVSSGGTTVVGLSSLTTVANLSKNKIYDLSGTASTSIVSGLQIANTNNSSTVNVSNNLIGNLTAPSATGLNAIRGIDITAAAVTSSTFNVYYNSVYLSNPTSGTGFGSSGIFHTISTTATTSKLDLRNNIIVNNSVQNGSGQTVAFRRSGGASQNLANYASTSNNNLFYAGTPGPSRPIYYDGISSAQTIAAYKAGVFTSGTIAPRDSASISENPPFLSTTGSSPNFLHINMMAPTQIESGGITVAGITTDFDGDTRNVSTPDIGADEGSFIAPASNDIQATAFVNPTNGVAKVENTAFAPQASFTNNGTATQIGVPVRYRICNDGSCTTEVYNDLGSIASIATGVTTTVTFANIPSGLSAGVYTIKATAELATDTVTSNDEITGTLNVIGPLATGTYTVGSGGNYPSLTNAGGIFETINTVGLAGPITIDITSNLTGEMGTNSLNQIAGDHAVLIKPSGGVRSITGAAAATALIRLSGASNVTIDGSLSGGSDRSLTIENTSTTAPQVVRFGSIGATPITANTLKNCVVINGANTSSAIVVTDDTGSAGTFNNIIVQNNDIKKAYIGIFTNATVLAGNGANLMITQNKLDTSGANAIRLVGIYVQGADGSTVSNNSVGNFNSTDNENDTGIWLATGAVNTTVSSNTVTTLGYTGTGAFTAFGIRDSGGAIASGNKVTANAVSGISTNGTATVYGIENSSGGTLIDRNIVQGVINTNISTYGSYGINITAGNNVVMRNNFVSNVSGNMTGGAAFSTTFGVFGVRVANGSGHQIYNNSINLYGLRAGIATSSLLTAAFAIVNTSSTDMDVRNNIFANNITGGTTSIANVSAYLPSGGTSGMNLTWNNNAYFFGTDSARQGAGQRGTTAGGANFYTSLPALAAYSNSLHAAGTNDNASQAFTTSPSLISNNDLHLSDSTSPLLGAGNAIGSVSEDYDGDPRPATAPDIGADEIVQATGGSIASGTFYNAALGAGETIGGDVTITKRLYLTGTTVLGGNVLTLGCDASVTGASSLAFIDGAVKKDFCATGAFSYPVGQNQYSPVGATVTAGTFPSSLTVTPDDTLLTGFTDLSRNWNLTETGDLTVDLTFQYDDSDVIANESNYRVYKRTGAGVVTEMCAVTCVDTVNNVLGPVIGVTEFSRWTGSGPLAPTAADVVLGGRVLTADGRGIKNAVLVISGNTLPTPMRVLTGPFGYYRFDGLEAGETYVVTVNSKRFFFQAPSRIVTLSDSVLDADFLAMPQE